MSRSRDTDFSEVALTMISMVPRVILVPMERAWKKDVFSGPSPVFCLGKVTLMGAMAPALAAAGTCREGQGGRGEGGGSYSTPSSCPPCDINSSDN